LPKILHVKTDGFAAGAILGGVQGPDFDVETVTDPTAVARVVEDGRADLVLVSCSVPGQEILRFCRGLREASRVPILLCASSAREPDIVRAFEAGVDDYLVTPIRPVELAARLRAVLRRTTEVPERQVTGELIQAGDLEIRLKEHKVTRNGRPVDLSPLEFRLLAVLVREVGRAVSHTRLLAQVWGPEYVDCRHYLRLYVKYLRAKLEEDPKDPKLILSEWGVGYRFEPSTG
jgi:two-component system KDP operon response regulator KdpE